MLIDSRSEFASKQTLTATGASTNVIDLQDVPRHIGPGRPLYLVVQVHETDGVTGDETYSLALQSGNTAAFDDTVDTLATLTIARSLTDKQYVIGFPYENLQFLRVNNTLAGTTPILNYSAYLTDQEPASWRAYSAPSQV